jgi:hypothetical protein
MSSVVSRAAVWAPIFDPVSDIESKNTLVGKSILTGSDLYASIQSRHLEGLNKQVRMLDRYAKSGDFYYGSPESDRFAGDSSSTSEIVGVLDSIEGEATALWDSDYKLQDPDFFAREVLIRDHGMVISYNLIGGLYEVLTSDFIVPSPPIATVAGDVVKYIEAGFVDAGLDITFEVTHTDTSVDTVVFRNTAILPDNDDYIHVIYEVLSDSVNRFYWTYNPNTEVYPSLNYIIDISSQSGWLPIIPLKTDFTDLVPADGKQYEDVSRAVSILGMDYTDLIDGVNENPDSNIIEHVSLLFAVDVSMDTPWVNDYLYAHYSSYVKFRFALTSYSSLPANNYKCIGIRERIGGDDNLTLITCLTEFVEERIVRGTFTEHKEIIASGSYLNQVSYTTDPEGRYGGKVIQTNSILKLRKRITEDTYSELVVLGARLYTASAATGLYEYDGEPNQTMLLVHADILKEGVRNPQTQKLILQQSLTLLVRAKQVTELKWYQEPEFRAFIIIVAVFLSAATLQPEIAAIATAATLLAAGELVFYLVLNSYLYTQITKYALEFLISEFGLEDTFIAVALVIIAAVVTNQLDALAPLAASFAGDFLSISLVVINAFMDPIDDALKAIETEYTEFLESAEERQEEIDTASELLGDGSIDPLTIAVLAPPILINETPSAFFDRTIHTGNIGVKSLDVIQDYVGNSLKLPETNLFM